MLTAAHRRSEMDEYGQQVDEILRRIDILITELEQKANDSKVVENTASEHGKGK